MRKVFITNAGGRYVLEDLKEEENGDFSGHVVNGAYNLSVKDGHVYFGTVNGFKFTEGLLIEVPDKLIGGYNDLISWAERKKKELQ